MRVERIGEGGRERERVRREEAREKLDRKEEEETLGMEGEGSLSGRKKMREVEEERSEEKKTVKILCKRMRQGEREEKKQKGGKGRA